MKRIECDRCGANETIDASKPTKIKSFSIVEPGQAVVTAMDERDLCPHCLTAVKKVFGETLPQAERRSGG